MADLLELIVFEVGAYRHVSNRAIGVKSTRWLFSMYEHVQRRRYNELLFQISAVELGVRRSAQDEKRRVALPTFEEMMQREAAERAPRVKPAWMIKYEEINRSKMLKFKKSQMPN